MEADLTVGGKVGLGEMALHSRANHHRRLHRLSRHFDQYLVDTLYLIDRSVQP